MASERVQQKQRAGRNRTLTLSEEDAQNCGAKLCRISRPASIADIENKTINQDLLDVLEWLPAGCARSPVH